MSYQTTKISFSETKTLFPNTKLACRAFIISFENVKIRNTDLKSFFYKPVNIFYWASPINFDALMQMAKDFVSIWSWHQWIFSLGLLILMYLKAGDYYNKRFSRWGGWMSKRARWGLIFGDLFINFAIGVYYMQYRDTFIGQFMLMCPVAISPFIFVFEMLLFFLFSWYRNQHKKGSGGL